MKRWKTRPTKKEVLAEIRKFFDLLKKKDVDGAEKIVDHQFGDWWPHQIRSLWQDLVGPWLEEQGEDWDLDDDKTWRKLDWLAKIDVDLKTKWNGKDNAFLVNVIYDGVVTDVSADFRLVKTKKGWLLQRAILHIA